MVYSIYELKNFLFDVYQDQKKIKNLTTESLLK